MNFGSCFRVLTHRSNRVPLARIVIIIIFNFRYIFLYISLVTSLATASLITDRTSNTDFLHLNKVVFIPNRVRHVLLQTVKTKKFATKIIFATY